MFSPCFAIYLQNTGCWWACGEAGGQGESAAVKDVFPIGAVCAERRSEALKRVEDAG